MEKDKPVKVAGIGIFTAPLSDNPDTIWGLAKADPDLIEKIIHHSSFLQTEKDIETFERRDNVIVTSAGYYIALYYDSVQDVDEDEVKTNQ